MRSVFQLFLLSVLAVVPAMLGCRWTEHPAIIESENRLRELREEHSESMPEEAGKVWYRIDTVSSSGLRTQTMIQQLGFRVTARSYIAFRDATVFTAWGETGERIGTHHEGATAQNFLYLHSQCSSVLQGLYSSNITLEHDEFGVIVVCTAERTECVDDCELGYRIGAWGFGDAPPL